jgi:hypothetical protein
MDVLYNECCANSQAHGEFYAYGTSGTLIAVCY